MTKAIKTVTGRSFLISDEDFDFVRRYRWFMTRLGYVLRSEHEKSLSLHRELLKAQPGIEVDHINGDPTDNRRENLRLATRQENARNHRKQPKRKYIGVYKHGDKWQAGVIVSRRFIYLGTFSTPEEAAKARDEAAKKLYKEFAKLNFAKGDKLK